tara:strand:+ start:1512 stop:2276 length:765 start_codon:yes stop_codon:yes gene_type:complete
LENFSSIFYGIVQGLTEFLPISSSGHTVLISHIFGFELPTISIDIFIHFGSLIGLSYYFWRNYHNEKSNLPSNKLILYIFCFSWIPILSTGYIFRDFLENSARELNYISISFVVSGVFIMLHLIKKIKINYLETIILMSVFQTLAVFPGVSRSGITIAIGLFFGLGVKKVILLSFLMSVPVIILASLYEVSNIISSSVIWNSSSLSLFLSFIIAAIFSFIGIKIMVWSSVFSNFRWFGYYNILLGIFIATSLFI